LSDLLSEYQVIPDQLEIISLDLLHPGVQWCDAKVNGIIVLTEYSQER
jgi:hypothetical protein